MKVIMAKHSVIGATCKTVEAQVIQYGFKTINITKNLDNLDKDLFPKNTL